MAFSFDPVWLALGLMIYDALMQGGVVVLRIVCKT